MERFDERTPKRIKEKNVYLLHLDTPRIIIISSVIIGVVIIAFLFGMNIKKEYNSSPSSKDIFSQTEKIFEIPNPDGRNNPGSTNPLSNSPIEKGLSLKLPENGNSSQNVYKDVLPENNDGRTELYPDNLTKGQKDAILKGNTKDTVPAVKEVTNHTKRKNNSGSYSNKKVSKREKVRNRNKSGKTNKIQGVSTKKIVKSKSRNRRKHYSIQIASFDRRSKATSARNKLRRQHYDAYIDRTSVRGKKYYRVRIGPISSKKKAVRVLTDIQDSSRYEESYLIRE